MRDSRVERREYEDEGARRRECLDEDQSGVRPRD